MLEMAFPAETSKHLTTLGWPKGELRRDVDEMLLTGATYNM